MIGGIIVLILIYVVYRILVSAEYFPTPFACRRKRYFDDTGLSKKLPKGRWKWK